MSDRSRPESLDPRDRHLAIVGCLALAPGLLLLERELSAGGSPGAVHAATVGLPAIAGGILVGAFARSRELRWLWLVGLLPAVLLVTAVVGLGLPLWAALPGLLGSAVFAQREPGDRRARWAARVVASLVTAAVGAALSVGLGALVGAYPFVLVGFGLLTLALVALVARDERAAQATAGPRGR